MDWRNRSQTASMRILKASDVSQYALGLPLQDAVDVWRGTDERPMAI